MAGFIALLLLVAVIITFATGTIIHWIPLALAVLVSLSTDRSIGPEE